MSRTSQFSFGLIFLDDGTSSSVRLFPLAGRGETSATPPERPSAAPLFLQSGLVGFKRKRVKKNRRRQKQSSTRVFFVVKFPGAGK